MAESVDYQRLQVAELRTLCDARGIGAYNKTKKQMMEALLTWDAQQLRELEAGPEEETAPSGPRSGAEESGTLAQGEGDQPADTGTSTAPEGASTDPESEDSRSPGLEPAGTDLWSQQALQKVAEADPGKYLEYMMQKEAAAERRAEREAAERRAEREREAAERRAEREAAERRAEREAAERQAARDAEERERQRQHELRLIEVERASQGSSPGLPAPEAASTVSPKFRFAEIEKDTDIDLFLRSFEKACRQYRLPQDQWARHLTPLLRCKALDAFAELPEGKEDDYQAIKDAIIDKYQLTPEVYRGKFRSMKKKDADSYTDVLSSLLAVFRLWTRHITDKSYAKLEDLMVQEQLLSVCPPEVRQFILERKPESAAEAATLADTFVTSRVSDTRRAGQHRWKEGPPRTSSTSSAPATSAPKKGPSDPPICFFCRKPGHLQARCPERKATTGASGPPVPAPRQTSGHASSVMFAGGKEIHPVTDNHQLVTVNDRLVTGLRDTGAQVTLVQPHLVPAGSIIPDKYLTLTGVGGTLSHIPQATVTIDWGVGAQEKVVGILDQLPVPVLLGTDLGRLRSYYEPDPSLSKPQEEGGLPAHPKVLCTPGQEQGGGGLNAPRAEAIASEVPSLEVPALDVQPVIVDENVITVHTVVNEMVNTVNDVSVSVPVLAVTRSQTAQRLSSEQAEEVPASSSSSDLGDSDSQLLASLATGQLADTHSAAFKQALQTDPSLEALRRRAAEPLADGAAFQVYWEGGRLYSKPAQPTGGEIEVNTRLLVIPSAFRGHVLKTAHDIPLAGHLGIHRTLDRIRGHFYWPKMRVDVTNYCRSCAVCQKVKRAGTPRKAPLCPLPVIGEPFYRVAVDIIGPLPIHSSSGKKYILTVVDFATRYPEAVALSSLRADKVADALLSVFSRVGFPAEMLSDQGPQFMSDLMAALCKKIHMTHLVSSPYHPQTNGLCERFNGTLKQMLSTFVESQGADWERYLPHLLFAYREVPQESTGFSPFELLYGRNVRGPLQLMREAWEGKGDPTDVSVVEYVLKFRDKMESLTTMVAENLAQAQARQKTWYDRNAGERSFEINDKVYALLPVRQNKLQAAWEGPYTIVKRLNPRTYLVNMGGRKQKSFHVNMLKGHHDRTPYVLPVCSRLEQGEIDPLPDLLAGTQELDSDLNVNPQLTSSQLGQLQEVLGKYRRTFSGTPGRTDLAVHQVDTGVHPPIKQTAYRVSPEVLADMQKEVREMLELGVVQKSCSAWAAPVVLVPKKDRTTRFCVDYRKLNAITTTDAYPMPRIDELLDKLAAASYLSIMDLSRGYWQIPLAPEARAKSAFITPFGLFEFTVMPFGMKNAPATFQRAVNDLLEGMQDFAVAYLDDIAVFSPTWEEHLKHMSQVLERLSAANLTVKPSKCQIGMTEVHYLGHRVGGNALKPDTEKVDAILAWPRPITKKQVMAFLGTAGYYRKFVPSYSALAKPLTDATRKKHPKVVDWTPECEDAFRALKQALASAPVLQAPDFNRRFVVQTDASDYGLGAVLSQVDEKGDEHPVLYLSRKLLPREVAYSTTEKECLAIVWALQKLQAYLYGRNFTIVTDHNPLSWLNRTAGTNGKLLRWSLSLQQYDFTIQHKAGSRHQNADGLSRSNGEPDSSA